MKKIFYILASVLVALSLAVGVSAEDIAVETTDEVFEDTAETAEATDTTEATETEEEPTETAETEETAEEETTAETTEEPTEEPTQEAESDTDEEPTPDLPDDLNELFELLGASTPEQVELVRQYLLYGLNTLPFSEKTKIAILEHINTVAWLLVGAAFIIMGILYIRSNKKSGDENRTMTDNAISIFEEGVKRSEGAASDIADCQKKIKNITDDAVAATTEVSMNADKIMRDAAEELLKAIEKNNSNTEKIISKVVSRESGLTDSVMTMCKIVLYLINESDLPEAERDAVTVMYKDAESRIKEVTGHDNKED